MTKLIQEALLPGTDAIPRATVEVTEIVGKKMKWRVRGKDRQGYPFHQDFPDVNSAMEYAWKKAEAMKF